ncbi:MAG: amidohydrolase family protein [Candidatus Aceula meridiana]|nr:amidohydrolase family protein [Candidatus Aceula meridiana]
MTGIIDFHSHYIPPEVAQNTAFFKVNWSDIDKQLHAMDTQGIEKALLFYPAADAHLKMGGWANVCRIYNEKIASVANKHRDRFIGAGIIPVDTPSKILDEAKRIQTLGLKIFSMASSYEGKFLDDEMFYPLYEFAQAQNFPIHVHPQIIHPIGETQVKDPLLSPVLEYIFDVSMCVGKMMMEGVFDKFKKTNFIFAHYGGILPFVKERFDNTYKMLRTRNFVKDLGKNPGEYFKNLYFETSGSKSAGSLVCALEITDAKHILFGSDYPANQNVAASIDTIKNSSLSAQEKQAILGQNALRLIP